MASGNYLIPYWSWVSLSLALSNHLILKLIELNDLLFSLTLEATLSPLLGLLQQSKFPQLASPNFRAFQVGRLVWCGKKRTKPPKPVLNSQFISSCVP